MTRNLPFIRKLCAAAVALCAGAAMPALAQDYPNKPVRVIVASAPGTTVDQLARLVTTEMGKVLGQPMVIENRSGAGQVIGVEAMAKAPHDGYSIGVLGVDGVALMPLSFKNLRFDPLKDVPPIASLAESRYVLTGPSSRPWKTFQEMFANAKANPGKLNYGASAPQVRFGMLVIMQQLGLDIVHIPFSSGASYLTALGAGTVDMGIAGEGTSAQLGARVRVYAITGKTRAAALPDVPTFEELGFPRVYGPAYSMNGPVGIPPAIVDKLGAAAGTVLAKPDIKASLAKIAFETTFEKADGAAKTLADRARVYAEFAAKANIVPE